ncbi:cotranscriptional regulator FAM172A [Puntigrus tetrazona]|uniref:cotranscriptional regulator FAM172A n=1 Tax=Puntigrus tetrazona TaxID=1606681 RepID=UPI001C89C17A|nr:cotranscriptional regulator FAM172A [Puntigrus tetrazona]XP_043092602.1 cotranscriptional regulator FAM172A [Puntigrus tetrazona]XP_043092607.1 cotranscriptional regulator FAM172A [Puntigrus tetrazona]
MQESSDSSPIQSDFPYSFSADGRLRHRATSEPYRFTFRLDDVRGTDREHGELCRYITQHVYQLLQRSFGLLRVPLEDEGFVFVSPGALDRPGSLLLLIQDRGTVRSGVWSWKLSAHEGLERGSQIPYLCWAALESCGVIVMNPNEGARTLEHHVRSVWERLVSRSAAEHVLVAAHGYGGLGFVDLLCHNPDEVQRRVKAVAFLDSSHSLWHQPLGKAGRDWLKVHSRTWILSSKPLNRSVGSLKAGSPQISAGTRCHDAVPGVCMESVLRFFSRSLKPRASAAPSEIITRSKSRRNDQNHNPV